MSVYLGNDPGGSGALAVLNPKGAILRVIDYGNATWPDVAAFIRDIRKFDPVAMTEQVASMPKQGVASMFKFGRNTGTVEGMLYAHEIPFEFVVPAKWQRALGIPPKPKKATKDQHKKTLREAAQRRWPRFAITANVADALLIAEYCRRYHLGILPQRKP